MELVNVSKYTSNKIGNFLKGGSGAFLKEDGTALEVSDLTTKQEYLDKVLTGELASTTDPKFIVRGARYTGDENSNTKAPDNIVNFDHIVLEGIPANADIQKYEEILKEQFKNVDHFYNKGGDKPQLFLGEREVFSRIDQKPNGDYHIHLLVNRHAIVSKEQLLEKKTNLDPSSDKEHIQAIDKALLFINSKGKDKALEQTCDFNDHYIQDPLYKKINAELQKNGLSPMGAYSTYSQNKDSNVKTTAESKTVANEVMNGGYTEEAVEKVIEKLQEEKVSSLDNVIVQKRLDENNKKMAELAEAMRKIASENKQLDEAQKAINDNQLLRNQNIDLVKVVSKQEKQITELETVKEFTTVLLEENKAEIHSKTFAIEELSTKLEGLENDYSNVEEELKITKEEKLEKEKDLGALQIVYKEVAEDLTDTKKVVEQYKEVTAKQEEEIKKVNAENNRYADMFEQLNKQMARMNADLEKQQITISEQAEKQQQLINDNDILRKSIEPISLKVIELNESNTELKAQNNILIEANGKLNDSVKGFTEFVEKLKNGYDNFAKTVKEKIKSIPDLKKQIAPVMKEHNDISKEIKPLIDTSNSNLTEAQRKMQEILQRKANDSKSKNDGPENKDGDNDHKNKFKPK